MLLGELRLEGWLGALRAVFLGGAGDFAGGLTRHLCAAAAAPCGLTPAAVQAAVETSAQVGTHGTWNVLGLSPGFRPGIQGIWAPCDGSCAHLASAGFGEAPDCGTP